MGTLYRLRKPTEENSDYCWREDFYLENVDVIIQRDGNRMINLSDINNNILGGIKKGQWIFNYHKNLFEPIIEIKEGEEEYV